MTLLCPVCKIGEMLEHDIGYDECSNCSFYAIYDDGRQPPEWDEEELKVIYENEAEEQARIAEWWENTSEEDVKELFQ